MKKIKPGKNDTEILRFTGMRKTENILRGIISQGSIKIDSLGKTIKLAQGSRVDIFFRNAHFS